MIDSEFHISLNGLPYRLAEGAEGEHYVRSREPLRAPNAQIVQGETSTKFNIRPDILLWSWTDWSGGEGQIKFDSENPNRAYIIDGAGWHARPGLLTGGYYATMVDDPVSGWFTNRAALTKAAGKLYAVGVGTGLDDYWEFSGGYTSSFLTGTSMAITDGAWRESAVCGDHQHLFLVKTATASVYKVVPGGSVTHLNNQAENQNCQLEELGDYLYKYNINGKVFELSKTTANTTTAETPIYDFSSAGGTDNLDGVKIVPGDNRVYVMAIKNNTTIIHEIVPSSASGTGFGREMARIEGQIGESMWWHGGFLWWTALSTAPDATIGPDRAVYYLQPGGAWGTIGEVRSFEPNTKIAGDVVAAGGGNLHTSAFVLPGTYFGKTSAAAPMELFIVDSITGGMGVVGLATTLLSAEQKALDLVYFDGYYLCSFVDKAAGTTYGVHQWNTRQFNSQQTGAVYSPYVDFDIAEEKILHSITVTTEPLPSNASVYMYYSLDDATYVYLGGHSIDGASEYTWNISTGGATKTFHHLRVGIVVDPSASENIVIKSVDVRASVNAHVNTWQLLIDTTDETSPRGYDGKTLQANLKSLADGSVFTFQDGYGDRTPGVYDTYSVVLDSLTLVNSQPGEGFAQIVLRSVL